MTHITVIITDVNECGTNNGGCSHTCVNMAGTHRCECPNGYTLQANKRDCVRAGEQSMIFWWSLNLANIVGSPCQRNNGGCQHICTNTQTGAKCSCRPGYQLVSGRTCRGIVSSH